jgi:hypothetical protein
LKLLITAAVQSLYDDPLGTVDVVGNPHFSIVESTAFCPPAFPNGLRQCRAMARENLGVTDHESAAGNGVAITWRKLAGTKQRSTPPGSAAGTRREL